MFSVMLMQNKKTISARGVTAHSWGSVRGCCCADVGVITARKSYTLQTWLYLFVVVVFVFFFFGVVENSIFQEGSDSSNVAPYCYEQLL